MINSFRCGFLQNNIGQAGGREMRWRYSQMLLGAEVFLLGQLKPSKKIYNKNIVSMKEP